MQYIPAYLFAIWNILVIGSLGVTEAWDSRSQDFIDRGLRLLQLEGEASYNLYGVLSGRLKNRQDDSAGMCNRGDGHHCGDHDDARKEKYPPCTLENLIIRKEWRFMAKAERRKYIDAVYCLRSKPSLVSEEEAPGSKSLYDSFSAANFLAWHRYFVWAYDKALREECGYEGASPYWEWGYDVYDPHGSAVFDGSPYSMGSDGAPLPNRDPTYTSPPPPPLPADPNDPGFPAGLGGGCVMYGPFSDWNISFSPVNDQGATLDERLRYSPGCLKRDMNPYIGQHYNAFNWSTWTIEESKDMFGFLSRLSGAQGNFGTPDFETNLFGVHGGGHIFLGGMTGSHSDFFASPQEPAFFLHHGQIDRLWNIWQWLDIEERRDDLYGTLTFANIPPTRNGTLDDILDMGPLAPAIPTRDAMSIIDGPFCYLYV
ncbi:hypothetical protein AJ79_10000 [Helicocarpus griseus UAMH5409]|uniref:Tyrosinase copper-binding domain-containing protein n=1 Tax=Helicocarpus griseus UAMH5409 TaxID=1447875 RepID=A0A2B7WG80_9EURO|nr:hypothetical protein AJ79_10000 [Helicocarpus griseus UAMH5409]